MELIRVEEPNWGGQLLQGLQRLYEHEILCDLCIMTTDDQTIMAHAVVVSVNCPLVTRQVNSTKERTLTLNVNLRHEVMIKLVDFMYYGQVSFQRVLLQDVWDGANQLRLQTLRLLLEKRLTCDDSPSIIKSMSRTQQFAHGTENNVTPPRTPSATTAKESKPSDLIPVHSSRITESTSSTTPKPVHETPEEALCKGKRSRDEQKVKHSTFKKPRERSPSAVISNSEGEDMVPRVVKVEPADSPSMSENDEMYAGFNYALYKDMADEGGSSPASDDVDPGLLGMGTKCGSREALLATPTEESPGEQKDIKDILPHAAKSETDSPGLQMDLVPDSPSSVIQEFYQWYDKTVQNTLNPAQAGENGLVRHPPVFPFPAWQWHHPRGLHPSFPPRHPLPANLQLPLPGVPQLPLRQLSPSFSPSQSTSPNTPHRKQTSPKQSNFEPRNKVLPKEAVDVLVAWLWEHQNYPYPSEGVKEMLVQKTKLTINQINYWFTNARRRLLPKWSLQRLQQLEMSKGRNPNNIQLEKYDKDRVHHAHSMHSHDGESKE